MQMETCSADQLPNDVTRRATASLPGLEIEIVHRRSQDADAEAISINLQAVPSFEAFGRFLEMSNPFAFWAQVVRMAWLPWLGAASAVMLPPSVAKAQLNPPQSQSLATKDR
jgi:hypothetical protein